jgi:hypothetical protein
VLFYMGACWKMVVVHGGEKRKKMRVKRHVTVT